MDSLITAAARALAAGDLLGVLNRVALRDDAHACIAYDEEAIAETWELTNGGRTRKALAGKVLAANNGELIARLAEDGQGVALLPHFIVDDALARGALKQVLAEWEPPELWLTLYYPPYDKLPMRVARFSDFFEKYVTHTRPL